MERINPDATLMVAFQRGDVNAFDQLLVKYHKAIVNFIYKIVANRAEAEDLAQDVFLQVYRGRSSYEPRASFAAWIYRIAANAGFKALRRRRRSPIDRLEPGNNESEEEIASFPDSKPDVEKQLADSETVKLVQEALLGLPKNEKIAIMLHRYEELSYKEIAEVMNCVRSVIRLSKTCSTRVKWCCIASS